MRPPILALKMFAELPEDRFEAFLSVPLVSQGGLVGVINLQNREACVHTEREIGLISTLGFLAGSEISRARLETEKSELTAQLEVRKVVERAKESCNRTCASAKKPLI